MDLVRVDMLFKKALEEGINIQVYDIYLRAHSQLLYRYLCVPTRSPSSQQIMGTDIYDRL